ncbi:MAG: DUF87 domain-containing protein [Anaerolineaceae bacterium]|nr:DUF87 domain-containing protein [Anaerolineaceae bacterium]
MCADSTNFFLGKVFDPKTNTLTADPALLDPSNLTTHAVITGMTGSGKTGLGIGLLEEAAVHGTPAIIIDPKGDLTNLLLHFPDLLPTDFEPWIDPEMARRDGKTVAVAADETSQKWKKGLADWGLGKEQIQKLKDSVDYAIYSPGSSSGIPVNILSSFAAPDLDWEENSEGLRERISSTITALLGLVGMNDIDPLRSREHILLSNLVENAWISKQSLSLTDLILQVQNPPMQKLGAFPMDSFFPEKDRFSLAMLLNNFLASPSFQVWQSGQALDIQSILYSPSGKPRHAIFYLAHLSENERMFFVTLLFAATESWMRLQQGTGVLRALVYFDEIMGYLPPVANPASKTVMLRMLKQARAFGVGLVLATQNPVDVDYKALSNAGTWLIGRLQTDQDKQRLLEGLSAASGATDVAVYDKLISGLQKRVFLWHSIYRSAPTLMSTRWTMNYLAGPLTRNQLPALNALVGAKQQKAAAGKAKTDDTQPTQAVKASYSVGDLSNSRPAINGDVAEYVFPNDLDTAAALAAAKLSGATVENLVYRPAVFTQAEVRYTSRQYNLDFARKTAALLEDLASGLVHWEELTLPAIDTHKLGTQTQPRAVFHAVPGWMTDKAKVTNLGKDFIEWLYRNGTVKIKTNAQLKVYAEPGTSDADFQKLCAAASAAKISDPAAGNSTYAKKVATLKDKIEAQEMDVKAAENEVTQRTIESVATGGAVVASLLGIGRKKSVSSSMTKMRMVQTAKDKLEKEKQTLENLQEQLTALQASQSGAQTTSAGTPAAFAATEIPLSPTKSDIFSDVFGIAWVPYYIVKNAGQSLEIPAFQK